MIKRIVTCIAIFSLFGISSVLAQGVLNTAVVPHDDATLERARNNYWNSVRTTGTEKDLSVIERKAYESMRQMQNRSMFKTLSSAAWTPIGSSADGHNSGRIRGIAIDPTNTNVVYIAAASGGIWKTNDISASHVQWINLSDRLPTTNFGSIAIDPSNPNILYAGTGESEGDNNQDLYGTGLYKTTDGGNNWTQLLDPSKAGLYCSQILVDETNSQRVYVATGSSGVNSLLKTTDGGATWKGINAGMAPLSLVYNKTAPNRLYISGIGRLSYSSDFGETWTKATLTGATSIGRITLACAPSAPQIIYALVGKSSTLTTLGVWISTDSAITWRNKYLFNSAVAEDPNTNPNPLGTQQQWCNAIAVRPILASQIVVAGLDVYSSGDSGAHMQKKSSWTAPVNATNYVHADIHHLEFSGNNLYACTDGGLAITTTNSSYAQWATDANVGVATMQFVGADADKDFTFTLGGCQDNGTLRALVTDPEFTLTKGGDGGRTWISPDDPNIAYTTYVYSTFYKSNDGGKTFSNTNLIAANTALFADATHNGEGAPFYPAYDVSSDGNVVAYGANKYIWVSMNGGVDAFADHHSNLSIPRAYTIHLSQQDPTYMFAGSGANLWRSMDEGATWLSKNLGETVTGITSDPHDHNIVYVVTQGSSANYKHFFASTDGGATFTNPTTQLSGIPCWAVTFDPTSNLIFIGTDNGPMYSEDKGVTWNPLLNGMPYVRVTSLKIKGNYLLASTYGRGLYSLDISKISGVAASANTAAMRITSVSPNPVFGTNGATVAFTLPSAGYCEARLFDALGREVRVLDKNYYDAGMHQIHVSNTELASGSYLVTLISGGNTVSAKLLIQ